ncbi:MAG: hypothetical protein ACT4NY_13055 [Pseudonocardiales bacterium]
MLAGEGSRVALEACGLADSATALAVLGDVEAARVGTDARELARMAWQVAATRA